MRSSHSRVPPTQHHVYFEGSQMGPQMGPQLSATQAERLRDQIQTQDNDHLQIKSQKIKYPTLFDYKHFQSKPRLLNV